MTLQITPLMKNLLRYVFHSHLTLCMAVFTRLPESALKGNKWAIFLEEILQINSNRNLFDAIKQRG
jgi:hypothetical protein